MAVSASYVAKETASNLRRNLLMTVGAMLTVAISLASFGGALLLRQAVNKQTERWRGGVELSIYLNADATPTQTNAIKAQLESQPGVKRFKYIDHAAAFQEMKKLFAKEPNVLEAVTEKDAPPSFRITPTRAELVKNIGKQFENQEGVKRVVYAEDAIDTLLKSTNQKKLAGLVIAVVFLVSSALLILTTIQLAIFARRREVSVMKLVGATNWFIRLPFMIEGMIQGLFGAIIAFAFVYLGSNFIIGLVRDPVFEDPFNQLFVTSNEALGTGIVLLLVGTLVGAIGSYFAVHRYLDV